MFNPHLFPLIIVDTGELAATTIEHQPAAQRRFEATADHKVVIRHERGRLSVWVSHQASDETSVFDVSLVHARLTDFSDHAVTFEGVEVRNFQMTGRTARVTFTNKHGGW